ncbi:hypothetical protein Pelo_17416 [Pelomyxa schiedti]|nr:hypothetical protein Pelo_17416 [Pelomyxa schiedti]
MAATRVTPELIKILLLGRAGCGKSSTANTMCHLLSGEPTMQFTVGDGGLQHTTAYVQPANVLVERCGRVTQYSFIDTPGLVSTTSESQVHKWWLKLKDTLEQYNPDFLILVTAAQDFNDANSPDATYARKLAHNLRTVQSFNFCSKPVPIVVTHVPELAESLSAGDAAKEKAMTALQVSTNVYPVENYGKELGPSIVEATNTSLARLFHDMDVWKSRATTAVPFNSFPCLLSIEKAWWGWDQTDPDNGMDVTAVIRRRVQRFCTLPPLRPTNRIFGRDPCFFWAKKLWITYSYNNQAPITLVCVQKEECSIQETLGNWPIWEDNPRNRV